MNADTPSSTLSNSATQFLPPWWLKNPHLQNILSSSSLRKRAIRWRNPLFFTQAQAITLDLPDDVTLMGQYNRHSPTKNNKMVILFHGWEGSTESGYVLSMATHLFRQGFDVFRLNFRDHGDTHHLNKGIFHSCLIDEVVDAVSLIQRSYGYDQYYLAGFSLGGNFALRVTALSARLTQSLSGTLAICPVFDPANTMEQFSIAPNFYENYFVKKWKASLAKKLNAHPAYNFEATLKSAKTLDELNHYFIPRHTTFNDVETYFKGYTLSDDWIKQITSPTVILSTLDDPIIPINQCRKLAHNPNIQQQEHTYGSHCAFLDSIALTSWADKYAAEFFKVKN